MSEAVTSERVVSLARAASLPLQRVGGKGRNLGRLVVAGLPVPPGFVIASDAWNGGAGDGVDLDGELSEALLALGEGPLAVRSSAPDEDAEDASAAGLYRTELDVEGLPAVLAAARACRASAEDEAARLYRGATRPAPDVAVVVQRMVRPLAAGVLFTRTGAPGAERVLIEATPGDGRALVDGRVRPARVSLAPDPAAVREGLHDVDGRPLLPAAVLAELVRLGQRAEALLGTGADVEWCWDGAQTWLLQARPITRAVPAGGQDRVVWTAANTQEALLDPVTPLSWSLLSPLVEAGRRDLFRAAGFAEIPAAYMKLFYGLPYFNPDYFRRFLRQVPGAPETIFDALIFGEGRPEEVELHLRALATPRTLRLLGLLGLSRVAARERFELFQRLFAYRLARLERRDLRGLSDGELLAVRRQATTLLDSALRQHVLGTAISGAGYLLLELFLRRFGVADAFPPGLAARLTAGATGNAVAAAGGRLEELARHVGAELEQDPGLVDDLAALARGPGAQATWGRARLARELRELLDACGHRCEKEAELLEPRWADDPTVLLDVVRSTVAALRDGGETLARKRAHEADLPRRARRLARRVGRVLARRSPVERVVPVRRLVFRTLLREARRYAPYRENLKDRALRALHLLRRVFLAMGERLSATGLLERPEDVFFLEVDEVEAALEGRAVAAGSELLARVATRRAERAANQTRTPPRYVVEVPGHAPQPIAGDAAAGGLIAGAGVSSGRRIARARVLSGMQDAARLGPGEVLVARVVNAAWTPLFGIAGAVVAEVGGVLSHGAIVAREYGIPAVFGAAGATSLPDGALVCVDGDLGVVTRVEEGGQRR